MFSQIGANFQPEALKVHYKNRGSVIVYASFAKTS